MERKCQGNGQGTLRRVQTKRKRLSDYRQLVGEELVDEIKKRAQALAGLRVLHLNSTGAGGGVAELLASLVPLMRDVGIDADWRILCHDDPFFKVTKGFHNALQGKPLQLAESDRERYLRRNEICSAMIDSGYDVAIVHDPQPGAMAGMRREVASHWIWRCHIDTSSPDPEVWDFLRPFVAAFDQAVFTMPEFVPSDLTGPTLTFIPPAIDPLAPKNRDLARSHARQVVAEFGVDLTRPLLLQVARFDPWKDPEGAIRTYHLVKRAVPDLQLALIGGMAADDPEGWEIYGALEHVAQEEPDIFLFTNLTGVEAHEVNCFQRVADVQLQKSIREGFGLVISEAMWKETPVVGGRTGGIVLQVKDGQTGYLVDSVEGAACRIIHLCQHPEEAAVMGRAGREVVRQRFLVTRLLSDWIELLADVTAAGSDIEVGVVNGRER